ncbi:site-specific integrase [Lysinibacillus xylanilyticus]|uniref:site-specific integrase n=1 Tax=Lysinibacillus xylanilyticus TaxID=582475 RepID=UPI00380B1118
MKVEKTISSYVLLDINMKIISEVLYFTNTLEQKGPLLNIVKIYLEDLKFFYLWLEQEKLKFYEVNPSDIPYFIEFIDNRKAIGKVSPATLNRYLATVSSFYRHIEVIGGFVEESPLLKIKGYYPNENLNKTHREQECFLWVLFSPKELGLIDFIILIHLSELILNHLF